MEFSFFRVFTWNRFYIQVYKSHVTNKEKLNLIIIANI